MSQRLHVCASTLDSVPRRTPTVDSASIAGNCDITAAGQSETPATASADEGAIATAAASVRDSVHNDAGSCTEQRERYILTLRIKYLQLEQATT
jgi:hypothetical protein